MNLKENPSKAKKAYNECFASKRLFIK